MFYREKAISNDAIQEDAYRPIISMMPGLTSARYTASRVAKCTRCTPQTGTVTFREKPTKVGRRADFVVSYKKDGETVTRYGIMKMILVITDTETTDTNNIAAVVALITPLEIKLGDSKFQNFDRETIASCGFTKEELDSHIVPVQLTR